jgi:SpoVK/Ycf46/Vps4 family AAA+-type ATPase
MAHNLWRKMDIKESLKYKYIMDKLNINKILEREIQQSEFKNILLDFENNKTNLLLKRGIYVYGVPGTGKTKFVVNILKEMDYDIIKYDAGDVRNAYVIEDITKHNMSDNNIMSLFSKKKKKKAIIMDEIDGMNNGDKGGINSLIKLIRPKKTKKQKMEEISLMPIICIGNYKVDKKIKELIKVCNTIELKTPTLIQMYNVTTALLCDISDELKTKIIHYIQYDLKKLTNMYNLYKTKPDIFTCETIDTILQIKSYNDDAKTITTNLINNYHPLNQHNNVMNETDRTSVGLLWHENIIDVIEKVDKKQSIPFYIGQLDNICFADYIDRITFQNQIWQFNEMSSLIKTFKNNKLYHNAVFKNNLNKETEVRFTKVLTKYSTEYNNSVFIQRLCQKLGMDKKDLFGFFIELSNKYELNHIINLLDTYEIKKLDINRINRYIEKYITEHAAGVGDKEIELEDDDLMDDISSTF